MNIYSAPGTKVRFVGGGLPQINWGGCDNPKGILDIGTIYTVLRTEVHSWHTKVFLVECPDNHFNSVLFEEA